jgi:hypothetical protein
VDQRHRRRPVDQVIEECVRVIVKSLHVGAGHDQEGIDRTPEIDFCRTSVIHAVEVTQYHGRHDFSVIHYDKVDSAREQMVYDKGTVAFPVIAGYPDHKGRWKNRKARNFSEIFFKLSNLEAEGYSEGAVK